ncbi:hypothetical protein [Sulfurospirillum arsenophilum]|uniref:hypothetical protein n=1 Tax=Sulfurospirillum arsenophilum TaxID=56698 RepID=UPI000AA1B612|nr:hypothetical protein [Sulfurospirillum arsenophilum]
MLTQPNLKEKLYVASGQICHKTFSIVVIYDTILVLYVRENDFTCKAIFEQFGKCV